MSKIKKTVAAGALGLAAAATASGAVSPEPASAARHWNDFGWYCSYVGGTYTIIGGTEFCFMDSGVSWN